MSPIVVDLQEQSLTNSCIDSVAINKRTLTFSYNTQNPAIQIDLPAPESPDLRSCLLNEDDTFINNAVLEANDYQSTIGNIIPVSRKRRGGRQWN